MFGIAITDITDRLFALLDEWGSGLEVDCTLRFDMPPGYETSNATYQPDTKVIHLNPALPEEGYVNSAFYLLHELRHARQHQHRQELPEDVARSLDYVILYDGRCYKRTDGRWVDCRLAGDEAYFTDLYTNLPYEVDANAFAYQALLPDMEGHQLDELESLHRFWAPRHQAIAPEDINRELKETYRRIDAAAGKINKNG